MTMNLNDLRKVQYAIIDEFAKAHPDGIQMYDFGDSTTTMPVPDFSGEGSYLTTSMCVLCKPGTGKFEWQIPFGRGNKDVVELSNGWKFLSVEFDITTTPEELKKKIYEAKDKLLAAP